MSAGKEQGKRKQSVVLDIKTSMTALVRPSAFSVLVISIALSLNRMTISACKLCIVSTI